MHSLDLQRLDDINVIRIITLTRMTRIYITSKVFMRKILGLFALVIIMLSGCAVYTPSGAVVVDPGSNAPKSGGKFCPPGQAKKGNC